MEGTDTATEVKRYADLHLFKQIADTATDFIGISNLKGAQVYVNASGLLKLGLDSFADVVQTKHVDYFHPLDRDYIRNEFMPRVDRDGGGETEVRFRHFITEDPIWMLYSVNVLRNEQGKPIGYAAICRDIEMLKMMESKQAELLTDKATALDRAYADIERMKVEYEHFAYITSHDLHEPLRKITIFSDMLKSPHTEVIGFDVALIDRIQSASRRMRILIDGMLALSRVSAYNVVPDLLDMKAFIEEVIAELETMIKDTRAVIEVKEIVYVNGDRLQLKQLFKNIISNSLYFRKPDVPPVIHIDSKIVSGIESGYKVSTTDEDKHFQLIVIKDNGIGFDPIYAENIFGIFQHLQEKSEYGGSGMGLTIAKKIVSNHKGYMWAESEQNISATFNILLPVSNGTQGNAVVL